MSQSRRKCKVCGKLFVIPIDSRNRLSPRQTCSYDCSIVLRDTNKKEWTKEEIQFIHDYANCLPSAVFYRDFKKATNKSGKSGRSFDAFKSKVNELGYTLTPVYNYIKLSDVAKKLDISKERVWYWVKRGLRVQYRCKAKYRYVTLGAIKTFAKTKPHFFWGIPHYKLYALIGDVDLAEHIAMKYTKRPYCIAKPRRIICLETNKIYDSLKKAADANFLQITSIYKSAKLKKPTCGLNFRYYDDLKLLRGGHSSAAGQ